MSSTETFDGPHRNCYTTIFGIYACKYGQYDSEGCCEGCAANHEFPGDEADCPHFACDADSMRTRVAQIDDAAERRYNSAIQTMRLIGDEVAGCLKDETRCDEGIKLIMRETGNGQLPLSKQKIEEIKTKLGLIRLKELNSKPL